MIFVFNEFDVLSLIVMFIAMIGSNKLLLNLNLKSNFGIEYILTVLYQHNSDFRINNQIKLR